MKSVVQLLSVLVLVLSGGDATLMSAADGSGSGMTIIEESTLAVTGRTTDGASASILTGISTAAVSSTPPVISTTFSVVMSRIDSSSIVPSVTIALSSTRTIDSFSVSSYSTSTTTDMLMPLTTTSTTAFSSSASPPQESVTVVQLTTSTTPVISSSSPSLSVSSVSSIVHTTSLVPTATPSFSNNSPVEILSTFSLDLTSSLSPSMSPSTSPSTSMSPSPSPSPSPSTSTSMSLSPTTSPSTSLSTMSPSPSTSMSPSPTTSVSPPPVTGLPVAIIAGAAGGFCVVIVCIVFVIFLVCCIRKRGRYELKTAGKDGTTLAREYQLETYGDFKDGAMKNNFEEVATTDTFGIKSPVEINVGGQKFTFPDLPSDPDENLPALIFINPLKPDELTSNSLASRSSTLPNRKKNKVLTNEAAIIADTELFGGQMKLSKSTSEINKDADPIAQPKLPAHIEVLFSPENNTSPVDSPVYDTPRTFKPLKSSHEKDMKSADLSTNAEYVTMEPLPKKEPSIVSSALQQPPVATKSAGVDRLAPKQTTESIYDNPRLMKSKPLVAEKTIPLQVSSTAASSIYDVPRKLLLVAESPPSTKETNSEVPVSSVVATNPADSVYDIPKKSSKTSVEKEVTKTENIQPSQSNLEIKSEDATVKPPLLLPKPSEKTKVKIPTEIGKPSISPKPNPVKEGTMATKDCEADIKPLIPSKPKPSIVGANSETEGTKPLILPKPNSAKNSIEATGTSKEADRSNKPLIPSKPNAAKTSTTEKPAVSEKPALKPRVSPKPGPTPNEQEKSVTPSFESTDDKGESSSDISTPEPMANSELESVEGFPTPKPRAKPRKATKRQVGMPQNLMQELFDRQSSQSKLADKSPPPSKPSVKPKPNVK